MHQSAQLKKKILQDQAPGPPSMWLCTFGASPPFFRLEQQPLKMPVHVPACHVEFTASKSSEQPRESSI